MTPPSVRLEALLIGGIGLGVFESRDPDVNMLAHTDRESWKVIRLRRGYIRRQSRASRRLHTGAERALEERAKRRQHLRFGVIEGHHEEAAARSRVRRRGARRHVLESPRRRRRIVSINALTPREK